eukprot:887366-Amphidinium_carterae.1
MIQRSYIKLHPTSGYSTATPEIKRVYDGFEIYNFNDLTNPRKPMEDSDYKATTLQQLLAISYHYAPTFFDTMKQQKLDHLRRQNWEEEQVQQHKHVLQMKKILELYIVLPQKALDMWLQLGKLSSTYMDNGTDDKHSWYGFHQEVQYTINNHINIYLYNFPDNFKQSAHQLTGQDYYFTM